MPLAELGDTHLYYQIHGPDHASRPAVILVHGLGSCSDDWELQLSVLSANRRVLAVDLRGHGRSPRADHRFQIRDLAGDVAWLARDLGLERPHWVGLSLGALTALQAGVDVPDQARSLTLVNGFARLRLHWDSAFSGAGRILLLMSGRMDWMGRWVARSLFPKESQADLRLRAARRIGENDRASYIRTLLAAAAFDVRNQLPGVIQPSLVVAGAEDRIVPMAAKVALAEGLPRARLEILPHSGHASPIDSAPEFNRLLVDFLDQVDASTD